MSSQTLQFEAQTALFSALTSSTDFMTAVSNKLFDSPPDNKQYPYVCLSSSNDDPFNRHGKKGLYAFFTFEIYTKVDGLGSYSAKNIKRIMDDVLNMQKFDLETSTFKMDICRFISSDTFKNKDIDGMSVIYQTILRDTSNYSESTSEEGSVEEMEYLHPSLSAIKSILKFNRKSLLFNMLGDSTSDGDTDWWNLFLNDFIVKYPLWNLYLRKWDDASQSYGEIVNQVEGSEGYKYARITNEGSNQVISTPHSASLAITGDIEISCKVSLDNWKPTTATCILEKWSVDTARSYMLIINATTGIISLYWSNDGTTINNIPSTAAPTVENGQDLYLKVTFDVDNGAGGKTAKFYQSSDGETWTQIGSDVTRAGTTNIYAGTNLVRLGSYGIGTLWHLNGKLYTATIRDGINGTPVLMYDSAMHYYSTTLKDLLGLTYTIHNDITMIGGMSLQALNASVSGENAAYGTARIADMLPSEADLIFVNYCHNEGSDVDYAEYKTLLDALKASYPRMGVVCCTQNQQNITTVYFLQHGIRNAQISKYAGITNSVLIDFFTESLNYEISEITGEDNVHPSADGYRKWADFASEVFENV